LFQRKFFFIICLIVALIVVGASFIALDRSSGTDASRMDKAALMYKKAASLRNNAETDKAVAAYFQIINDYPVSGQAEKAYRDLASIYDEKGDKAKARYYNRRLLNAFPGIKDAEAIRSSMEDTNMRMLMSPAIGEDSIEYVVQPGDSLYVLARKFNTTIELIKKVNGLEGDTIRVGQRLKIIASRFSVLVDKHTNRLVLKKDGEPFKTYVISTGKDNCTPVGTFKVEEKMIKPVWYKVGAVVSPESSEYELGARWMGISAQGYGIHGTSDESTIGSQVTQGCVRMYNDDVVELYDIIPSGTEVVIVDSAKVKEEPRDAEAAGSVGKTEKKGSGGTV